MPQRPNHFRLNMSHPLANGLVFAGLGSHAGSTRYHDSSPFGNHGTLTNYSSTQFNHQFDITLNRNVLKSTYVSTYWYTTNAVRLAANSQITFSVWAMMSNDGWLLQNTGGTEIVLRRSSNVPEFILNSFSTNDRVSGGTVAANTWTHLSGVFNGTTLSIYVNGASVGSVTPTGSWLGVSTSLDIGSTTTGSNFNGAIGDPLVHRRGLADTEILQLADPSNVMLSGLINYPRRKWWPVASGAAPAFKTFWANRATQVAA